MLLIINNKMYYKVNDFLVDLSSQDKQKSLITN